MAIIEGVEIKLTVLSYYSGTYVKLKVLQKTVAS